MKSGYYAIYLGKEYSSTSINCGKIILRSTDFKDVKNGFEICEPFKYRNVDEDIVCMKHVEKDEVREYYYLRTYALYKGYKFYVLIEKDNQILIVATVSISSPAERWINLGMKMSDRDEYQKWISKDEAEIIIERENLD